ncbi:MAG: hypothetical protein KAH01_03835 [Caldisericia bacterium]|nr:hypothetical protein [Caldisericia bacterium]
MTNKKPDTISSIFIIFCFLVAIIIIVQVVRTISFSPKTDTFSLDIMRIEVTTPGNGYNSKTEFQYFSPIRGTVKRLKNAGSVVRVGSPMLSIDSDETKTELSSQHIGILSYIRDGLESTYTVENALNGTLSVNEILDPATSFERVEDGKKVNEGDFVCKVVGNDLISYVLVVEPKFLNKLVENSSATFSLTYPTSMSISGTVNSITHIDENNAIVVFSTPYYIDVLLNTRKIEGYFSYGFHNASLMPMDAIKEVSPGNYALYYIPANGDIPVFTSVDVIGIQPGTNYYIVSSFVKEKKVNVENFLGVQICNSWESIEKEIMENDQ